MGSQPQLQEYVKDIYKADDYTVEMELTKSYPRMHNIFTSLFTELSFMQPKHIWEEIEIP